MRGIGWLLVALAGGACQAAAPPAVRRSAPPPAPAARRSSTEDRAAVVVVAVFDQLGSDTLAALAPHLNENGAIQLARREGAWHARVRYAHAVTDTAPGHAAIATGRPARDTGIAANASWSEARQRVVPVMDGGRHAVLGVPDKFASPLGLRARTVADALHERTAGAAKIVSLSLKDRSAILLGGRHADLVAWYEPSLPGFTTSTYYPPLPGWWQSWHKGHPPERLLVPWHPLLPADTLGRILGPDAAPGEGRWLGWDTELPHDPAASSAPYDVVRLAPALSERLLALAATSAEQEQLGVDATPDLLSISISGTDFVGHIFGPHSWEYFDHLYRADLALGALLRELAERRRVSAVLTSDHGVSPLVERVGGERLYPAELVAAAEAALDVELGAGDWVRRFVKPFLYLSPEAKQPKQREQALRAATDALAALDGVRLAVSTEVARGWISARDPIQRAAALSVPQAWPGDVIVLPAPDHVFDEGLAPDAGTSHGSPWPHDSDVPALLWGAGVERAATSEPLDQARVAASVAALLRIPWSDEPLPGVTQPDDQR